MQIHIVQQGQSLFSIAQAYGTSAQEIVRTNEIPNPNALVIGQAIVIPIQGGVTGYSLVIVYTKLARSLVLQQRN